LHLLLIVAAAVVGLDQLSKYIVSNTMETGQSIAVIRNFLYITYLRNPGAAFGMLPYRTVFFIIVTILVIGFIIYYYRTLPPGFSLLRFGLALQLGGALGNLVDRLRGTYVIDFIDVTIFPPIFNLADTAIVIGIILFLIGFWRMSPALDGKQ
jgi:signal peptidase II